MIALLVDCCAMNWNFIWCYSNLYFINPFLTGYIVLYSLDEVMCCCMDGNVMENSNDDHHLTYRLATVCSLEGAE